MRPPAKRAVIDLLTVTTSLAIGAAAYVAWRSFYGLGNRVDGPAAAALARAAKATPTNTLVVDDDSGNTFRVGRVFRTWTISRTDLRRVAEALDDLDHGERVTTLPGTLFLAHGRRVAALHSVQPVGRQVAAAGTVAVLRDLVFQRRTGVARVTSSEVEVVAAQLKRAVPLK